MYGQAHQRLDSPDLAFGHPDGFTKTASEDALIGQISQTDFFSVLHFVHENDRQMYFDIFTQEQLQLFVLSSSTGVEATIIAYILNYR